MLWARTIPPRLVRARSLASMVLLLGAGGYCLAVAGRAFPREVPGMPLFLALWLGCTSCSPQTPYLCRAVVALGSLLLSFGQLPSRRLYFGNDVAWIGAGLSFAAPVCGLRFPYTGGGGHGLRTGAGFSAFLTGFAVGITELQSEPGDGTVVIPRACVFTILLQMGGTLLLDVTKMTVDLRHEHSISMLNVVLAREFWTLVGIAAGLAMCGRCFFNRDPWNSQTRFAPICAAPFLWGMLGCAAGVDEPQTLALLLWALCLGTPLVLFWEAYAGCSPAAGRVTLWHVIVAAVAFHMSAVSFCFGATVHWLPLVVAFGGAVALTDRVLGAICVDGSDSGSRWALGMLGPLMSASLCSRFLAMLREPVVPRWVEGYTALQPPTPSSWLPERNGDVGRRLHQRISSRLQRIVSQPSVARASCAASQGTVGESLVTADLIRELWPHIRVFVEHDLIKGEVEPLLQRRVIGALRFERMSLGDEPPQVRRVWVPPPTPQADGATLALDIQFTGEDVSATLKFALGPFADITASVTKLAICGTLFFVFRHPMPHFPLVHGMNVFFANPPNIDARLSLPAVAGSLLPERITQHVTALLNCEVGRICVLPNRVSVPFAQFLPLERLTHTLPEGVIACRVIGVRWVAPLVEKDLTALGQVYVRLQVGAQTWASVCVSRVGGSAEWNQHAFLIVDWLAAQDVIVSLLENQTFGDVHLARPYGFPLTQIVMWSGMVGEPMWALPGSDVQLRMSAQWHGLSVDQDAESPGIHGTLLVVSVDCVQHLPEEFDNRLLVVRVFFVDADGRPEMDSRPVAESLGFRASKVHQYVYVREVLRRLQRRGFEAEAGEGENCSDLSAAEVDEWRRRLEYAWQHLRTDDGSCLADWVARDRESCIRLLVDFLGANAWEEPTIARLVDDACRAHCPQRSDCAGQHSSFVAPQPTCFSHQTSVPSVAGPPQLSERPCWVECHLEQQLRAVTMSLWQDVWIEVAQVRGRSGPRRIGACQLPLRDLLPSVLGPAGARLREWPLHLDVARGTAGGGCQAPTLCAKLEAFHLLPPESF